MLVKNIITAFLALLFMNAMAQTKESFDIVSFQAPKNWKKELTADRVTYTATNQANGGYCVISLFKSTPIAQDVNLAFDNEWKELVTNRYKPSGKPEFTNADFTDGWKMKSCAQAFQYDGGNGIAILSLFTKNQAGVSLLVLMNKEDYITDMENFIASMQLTTPATQTQPTKPANTTVAAAGFRFNRSDFDDGWVSSIHNDYVMVEKGNNSVYLLFHVPYNASQFSGTGLRDVEYYWDNYLTKYFTTQSKQFNDGGAIMKAPYMEGYAMDKRTGKSCFVGLYLLIVPNATKLVIGTATDERAFRALYPMANDFGMSDLAAMDRFNKFAVAAEDLLGKWQNGNTSTAQWYYTSPSGYEGYAGMTLAATSAEFTFNNNGTYTSIHNGATGAVGNMKTFQQEYKGDFTVSNWQITATNRYGGKTHNFSAYFIAVKSGRLLKLNNGAGEDYTLVRVNR